MEEGGETGGVYGSVDVTHAMEREVFREGRRVVTTARVDDEADPREVSTAFAVRHPPLRDIEGPGDLSRRWALVEEREDGGLGGFPALADDIGVFPVDWGGLGPCRGGIGEKDGRLVLRGLMSSGPQTCRRNRS